MIACGRLNLETALDILSPGTGARDPGMVWSAAQLNPDIHAAYREGWALEIVRLISTG